MRLTYTGPADQRSTAIGTALGNGGLLEHGATYDLPDDLATSLLEGSAWFENAGPDDLDQTKVADLKEIADDLGIEGAASMKGDDLREAIRAARSAAASETSQEPAESTNGAQELDGDATEPVKTEEDDDGTR